MIDFPVYKNDGTIPAMRALIDLKNIIAKQLPKMPKEYITRLIMDRNHESMLLVRKTSNPIKVIGGVVYRPFEKSKFVEIAFLAITSLEQVRGYGTRLMNKLKAYLQGRKIKYMLTYADNNAIGFFKKQGFSTFPRMPTHLWMGYIKDYDSGTLMDCYLNPDIDYNNISDDLKKQKAALLDAVKKCYYLKKYNGLDFPDSMPVSKKKKTDGEESKEELKYEKQFYEIPGLVESGWDVESYKKSILEYDRTSFFRQCQNTLKLLNNHSSSWPFKKPVNLDDVPDYSDYIKNPMDLETMEHKLESRKYYRSKEAFIKDVQLIIDNAKTYNKPTTIYYRYAVNLEEYIKPHLEQMTDPTEVELEEYDKQIAIKEQQEKMVEKKAEERDEKEVKPKK